MTRAPSPSVPGLSPALAALLAALPARADEGLWHVVDVGAHKGRTARAMLHARTDLRVTAVEANPRLAARLRKRLSSEPRIRLVEAALGEAEGRAVLRVLPSTSLSSLLCPSGLSRKYPDRDLNPEHLANVRVARLDDVAGAFVDAIKLDVQGFELAVLKGAPRALSQARAVVAEVSFAALYEGAPLAGEVEAFMQSAGFTPSGLYDQRADAQGRPLSADALFLRAPACRPHAGQVAQAPTVG